MIEAPEYVTPTQRKLHDQYLDRHRKFFPSITPRKIQVDQTNLRLKLIKKLICQEFRISEEILNSHRRSAEIVLPRHMFSYLASLLTRASLPHLGKSLGGQDHTTILHAIRQMKIRVCADRALGELAKRLEGILRQQFGDTDKPRQSNQPRNLVARYIADDKVAAFERVGWLCVVNNYAAAVVIWPCACECVEPKE